MTSNHLKISAARVLLAVMLLGSTLARGATFHVSPLGSNTPPYDTYAKAAHRIADAVAYADSGDIVRIGAGTYAVDSVIVLKKSFITFQGAGIDSTFVVPDTGLLNCFFASGFEYSPDFGFEFSDMTLQQVPPDSYWVSETNYFWLHDRRDYPRRSETAFRRCRFVGGRSCLNVFDCYLTVESCQFEDYVGHAVAAWGVGPYAIHNNVFRTRRVATSAILFHPEGDGPITIQHNTCLGGWQSSFVSTYFSTDMTVTNNYVDVGFWALYVSGIDIVIRNNFIAGGRDSANQQFPHVVGFELYAGDRITVENNVLLSHHPAGDVTVDGLSASPGPLIFRYNDLWRFSPESVGVFDYLDTKVPVDTAGLIWAYPMLAPDSSQELQRGSPLIHAGNPDITNVDGTRSDIGILGGPGGTSYQYRDFPPLAPESLTLNGQGFIVQLRWPRRPEADVASYRLYRGNFSGFWNPGQAPVRTVPAADSSTSDSFQGSGPNVFYVVTAVDSAGLESVASPEALYIFSGVPGEEADEPLPRTPQIARIYPNPFNAATTIEVFIPDIGAMPAPVRITLYNVMGRLVSVPFEGSLMPGHHAIPISATDAPGHALASGVYFARLRVWGAEFGGARKLVVLK